MNPFLGPLLPRALCIVATAVAATCPVQSQAGDRATAVSPSNPPIEWAQFNRWENGSIEAMMGSATVGFLVFMPLAYHCRAPVVRPVSEADVVTVYRGPNVRNAMPLGGGVPPVSNSVRVDKAISGSIHCEAHSTPAGENNVTLRLVNIELEDATYKQVGPVEAIPSVPPP